MANNGITTVDINKPARRTPPMINLIGALILEVARLEGELYGRQPVIGSERAKTMTAKQLRALMHFDHNVYYTWGGSNLPHNLTPRWVRDHIEKTAKVDQPIIAKVRRNAKKRIVQEARLRHEPEARLRHDVPEARLRHDTLQAPQRTRGSKPKWPSRRLPGGKNGPLKKKLTGRVEQRQCAES